MPLHDSPPANCEEVIVQGEEEVESDATDVNAAQRVDCWCVCQRSVTSCAAASTTDDQQSHEQPRAKGKSRRRHHHNHHHHHHHHHNHHRRSRHSCTELHRDASNDGREIEALHPATDTINGSTSSTTGSVKHANRCSSKVGGANRFESAHRRYHSPTNLRHFRRALSTSQDGPRSHTHARRCQRCRAYLPFRRRPNRHCTPTGGHRCTPTRVRPQG